VPVAVAEGSWPGYVVCDWHVRSTEYPASAQCASGKWGCNAGSGKTRSDPETPFFRPSSSSHEIRYLLERRDQFTPRPFDARVERGRQTAIGLRLKKETEKNKVISDFDAGLVKSRKAIEEARNNKSYPPDLKQKMISSMEEGLNKQMSLRDKLVKNAETLFEGDSRIIDDYINQHSPETLGQQAVVNEFKDFTFRKKFDDPGDKNSRALVYVDQSYFNKNLPSYMPQFFVLMWRWNNCAPGLFFNKQMEENFPVEKLKALIPD